VCGRLLCCLAYENDAYTAAKEVYPNREKSSTQLTRGKIVQVNVIKETCRWSWKPRSSSRCPTRTWRPGPQSAADAGGRRPTERQYPTWELSALDGDRSAVRCCPPMSTSVKDAQARRLSHQAPRTPSDSRCLEPD